MKVTLNKSKSVFSNNVESDFNIDLSTKVRLLPSDSVVKKLSLIEQYNRERDECNNFRLIFAINPICSNVLYNSKTEIVINEGGENKVVCDCKEGFVNKADYAPLATNSVSSITYMDALRNTEYSHPKLGNFTYHCGYDIFNNHMLRNDGYVHVNKIIDSEEIERDVYNTIADYSRNNDGEVIKQDVNIDSSNIDKVGKTKMHLYKMDNIISMRTAFYERCEERDGWWGFINPSNINIANRVVKGDSGDEDDSILTNTLIASKKPCDFIDLYPDRSLYSFIPKYNKFRNRLEKNWDYCITYPFENDYEQINKICAPEKNNHNYSIRVNFIKKYNSNGHEILECSSYFNHNLKINSDINIYYYVEGNDGIQKLGTTVKVENIGDALGENKNKIFTINYMDIASIYKELVNSNQNGFYFKKVNNNHECRYYFRKFKKLKNNDGGELQSDINKIAFGKNIYGDDVAQIIFTDDINISGLLDNNNRPLSEVYLTTIKRNAGHDIWYESGTTADSDKNNENVEFSHCFGKITSGLDFSGMKKEPFNYNIHMMHNLNMDSEVTELFNKSNKIEINDSVDGLIFTPQELNEEGDYIPIEESAITINDSTDIIRTLVMWGDSVFNKPLTIEDDITINNDVFYGDVVEFDDVLCKETTISNIYHRVNTAQRETFDICFKNILEDKIIADDYDIYTSNVEETVSDNFKLKTYYLNNAVEGGLEWNSMTSTVEDVAQSIEGRKGLIYGNIMPEGNYYNPHFKIILRSESPIISESVAKIINYADDNISIVNDKIIVTYPSDFKFKLNEYIAFFNKKSRDTYWGKIEHIDSSKHKITIKAPVEICIYENNLKPDDFKGATRIYNLYWSPDDVPVYANILERRNKFVWRSYLKQSELQTNDPLYNTTFSNGRLYIEKNINFYLRRQDPFGKYGLSIPKFEITEKIYSNPVDDFILKGDKQADFTGLIFSNNNFDNCF